MALTAKRPLPHFSGSLVLPLCFRAAFWPKLRDFRRLPQQEIFPIRAIVAVAQW